MIDGCGREIDHLRLSLTDHCDLSCRYCISGKARSNGTRGGGIDAAFAYTLVRWLSLRHGIRHVRLTGGEPLLYRALIPLIEKLSALETLHEVTLTTNGQALAQQAERLRAAGLARVNVSLDTLDRDRFAHTTRGGNIHRTLIGIEAAVRAGLTPVKINVVAQRGLNDEELPDLAAWGLSRGCVVRFLEVMPIGPLAHMTEKHLVPASETLERLAERFDLRPIPQSPGQPAQDYAVSDPDLRGVIGVIAPTTRPFCSRCRRLRVTSRGQLVACVHDRKHFDLTRAWDGQRLDPARAERMLQEAVAGKPDVGPQNQAFTMLAMGG